MRYLETFGLVVVAFVASVAFAGAGSASAAVLCKVTATPCGAANHADTLSMSLVGTSTIETTAETPNTINTCTAGNLHLVKETTGSATETSIGVVSKEGFTTTNCSRATTVLSGGTLEVHHIPGTHNGTVTGQGFEVTFLIAGTFSPCTYRLPEVTDIGALEGGTTPRFRVNVMLQGGSVLCPPFRWTATYHVTSPTPIYVEPS